MRTRLVPVVVVGALMLAACGSSSEEPAVADAQEAPAEESSPAPEEEEEEVVPAELIGRYEASVPMTAHPFGRGRWEISIDQNAYNGILDAYRVTPLQLTAEEKQQVEATEKKGGVSGLEELGNHIAEQFVAEEGTVSFPEGTIGCSAPASYAYSVTGKKVTWKTVEEDKPCDYRTFLFEVAWTKVSPKP